MRLNTNIRMINNVIKFNISIYKRYTDSDFISNKFHDMFALSISTNKLVIIKDPDSQKE